MRWLALRARNPGQGGGGSAALADASVDVCGGDGAGRGGGAALALLGLRWGQATDAVASVGLSLVRLVEQVEVI